MSHICFISNTGFVYNRLSSQNSSDEIYLVPNIYNQNNRIGEVGKSNISNDYLLHFQIWKNENKLDPQDWLK